MADTKISIFASDGTTAAIDYRSEATNGDGRQVIVIGDPLLNANVAAVTTQDVSGQDQLTSALLVRMGGSVTLGPSSNTIGTIGGITNSIGVNIGKIDGTIQVNVGKIDDYVAVRFNSTPGTVGINVGKVDGTIQVNIGKIDDYVAVRFNSTPGTVGVNLGKVDGTIQVNVGKIDDSVKVVNISGGTLAVNVGKIDDIVATNIKNVYGVANGTLTVKIDPAGYALVNAFHTANIFNASGTWNGNSASGGTVISPSANASFKIFAFSLSTTAQSNIFAKFTNGSGGSPTEYWRVALQAPSQGISGANLAVPAPSYLWATGVSTTLSLVLDSASLVHYSVAYIKESA